MKTTVHIESEVLDEIDDILKYYEGIDSELGLKFKSSFETRIKYIVLNPEMFKKVKVLKIELRN